MTAPRAAQATSPDQRVESLLREVLGGAREQAGAFGSDYQRLWSEIERSVCGGKRFRSSIVLGTHRALGGTSLEDAVPVAAAFELLHTAFLIHDDLIDRDTVRRGEPNLAATMRASALATGADDERAQRWSEAAAVLAGDLALSRAHRLIAGVGLCARRRTALLDLMDETLLISAGGELDDTAFGLGLGAPGLREALLVCESKTAMYSFRAPLRAGAIVADAGADVLRELDRIGRMLGRAFQLVDDLLGVFAPEELIGKSNVSDLREGKLTALVLHARTLPEWSEIEPDFGRADLDATTADRLRGALARSAAPGLVADHVRADLESVRASLGVLPRTLAPVVGAVVDQVEGSLETVLSHVEEARCRR
ncbi:polyprenyl synthetase family protein [Actinotalea sp. C106]|uniref:polyprenyl synthetase family protein n=1 Tax=Actinotalea sp. C106 TaxID=2908644 RepID=UPI0020282213|nr:polyprenyl synthetase family protein [Actinotalea sp. C106]